MQRAVLCTYAFVMGQTTSDELPAADAVQKTPCAEPQESGTTRVSTEFVGTMGSLAGALDIEIEAASGPQELWTTAQVPQLDMDELCRRGGGSLSATAFAGTRARRSPIRCRRGWQNAALDNQDTPREVQYEQECRELALAESGTATPSLIDALLNALGFGNTEGAADAAATVSQGEEVMQSPRTVHKENEVLRSECALMKAEIVQLRIELNRKTKSKSPHRRARSRDATSELVPQGALTLQNRLRL